VSNFVTGTPDWQRGVFSPQKLVASVPINTGEVTVNMPANTEALLIIGAGAYVSSVTGTTTNKTYTFIYPTNDNTGFAIVFVSPAVDPAVKIMLELAPAPEWYVVADAGVRTVVDAVLASAVAGASGGGVAPAGAVLVAGSSPSFGGGDAYVLETDDNGRLVPLVPTAAIRISAAGEVLAAQASGAWYLFGLDVQATVATGTLNLDDVVTSDVICFVQPPAANTTLHVDLGGYRCAGQVNAGLSDCVGYLRYAPGP